MTVGIVASPDYALHKTGKGHPERPSRETVIRDSLKEAGFLNSKTIITPRIASEKELELCHTKKYIALAKKEIEAGKNELSTGDVVVCPKTYEIALLAVGGVLAGVDAILNKLFKRVFCVVRPPGHHATIDKGMGFCVFNNAAIAARYYQKKAGIERVLIVDWDVHHGNGTENIFKEDKSVFYFSTHLKGIYPGTGSKDFDGVNNVMNVPIPGGSKSRLRVIDAFSGPLVKAMKSFKPQFVIISCGFDGHKNDPLGGFEAHKDGTEDGMNLESKDFGQLTRIMVEIANEHCEGRMLSVLEGGYNLQSLEECSIEHVRNMGAILP